MTSYPWELCRACTNGKESKDLKAEVLICLETQIYHPSILESVYTNRKVCPFLIYAELGISKWLAAVGLASRSMGSRLVIHFNSGCDMKTTTGARPPDPKIDLSGTSKTTQYCVLSA